MQGGAPAGQGCLGLPAPVPRQWDGILCDDPYGPPSAMSTMSTMSCVTLLLAALFSRLDIFPFPRRVAASRGRASWPDVAGCAVLSFDSVLPAVCAESVPEAV